MHGRGFSTLVTKSTCLVFIVQAKIFISRDMEFKYKHFVWFSRHKRPLESKLFEKNLRNLCLNFN